MPLKAPAFWRTDGPIARALTPAGAVYAALGRARWWLHAGELAAVPVLCVGNATVGGTGKTPIVLDLLQRLQRRGHTAHGLCRGHGGRNRDVVRVDPKTHSADDVGDEALLLAEVAPTWAGRDRREGARLAAAAGADVIVLDDGLQYPRLAKTASLLVIDAATGFGNGRVLPAGPLREPLSRACDRADAAVLVGEASDPPPLALPPRLQPPGRCTLGPTAAATALAGRRFVAFAGIGRPEKLFAAARAIGAELVATQGFADHHRYRGAELAALERAAGDAGAALLTTAKDRVRLDAAWQARVEVLEVEVQWADGGWIEAWLDCHVPR